MISSSYSIQLLDCLNKKVTKWCGETRVRNTDEDIGGSYSRKVDDGPFRFLKFRKGSNVITERLSISKVAISKEQHSHDVCGKFWACVQGRGVRE